MGFYITNMIKYATITFIGQKAFKCLNKKDYGDLISFIGVLAVGVEFVSLILYLLNLCGNWWENNPVMQFFFNNPLVHMVHFFIK